MPDGRNRSRRLGGRASRFRPLVHQPACQPDGETEQRSAPGSARAEMGGEFAVDLKRAPIAHLPLADAVVKRTLLFGSDPKPGAFAGGADLHPAVRIEGETMPAGAMRQPFSLEAEILRRGPKRLHHRIHIQVIHRLLPLRISSFNAGLATTRKSHFCRNASSGRAIRWREINSRYACSRLNRRRNRSELPFEKKMSAAKLLL